MRDVHAGTYAIVAIAAVFAMKWAGLAALPRAVRYETLLLTPCLARFAMLLTSAAFPYARPKASARDFHDRAWPAATIAGAITAAVAAIALLGAGGLLAARLRRRLRVDLRLRREARRRRHDGRPLRRHDRDQRGAAASLRRCPRQSRLA